MTPQGIRKRRTDWAQTTKRTEIIKFKAETCDIGTKKTTGKKPNDIELFFWKDKQNRQNFNYTKKKREQ